MNFKNIRIGKRLGIGFGILGLMMIVLIVTGITATTAMNSRLADIAKVNSVKTQSAYEAMDAVKTLQATMLTGFVLKDEASLKKMTDVVGETDRRLTESLGNLDRLERSEKVRGLIKALKENQTGGIAVSTKVAAGANAGNVDEALKLFVNTIGAKAAELFDLCHQLIQFQKDEVVTKTAEAYGTYRTTIILMLVMGVIILCIAAGLTTLLTRSISVPIGKAVEVTEMLAAGKLTMDVAVDRKDEFGDQAIALKGMVEKWRDIVGSIKEASDGIAISGAQLSGSAGNMSDGANQQADRAQQVAAASEEMSQTVNDIARSAENMSSVASQTALTAQSGGKTVAEAVREVEEIASTVSESADHITSLAKLSQKIGDIISIINEIADQTNLLALNAAIEAARAGEHGRGFAVVADEVRKLAERTTAATSEVTGIIKEIQTNVTSAVSSIDQVSAKVERGVSLSNKAGSELHHIVKSVDDLQAMVQQIAVALDEMTATSDQISHDIESISSIATQTSQSSGEVTRASRELAQLGNNLQGISKRFEL
jgi:methyl-accepting chemotaxis protein